MPDNLSPENARAVIGGNRPPVTDDLKAAVDGLPTRVSAELAEIRARTEELKSAFATVPEVLDANSARIVSDIVAQITAHVKAADVIRTAMTAPVLFAQRTINGQFNKDCFDDLDPDGKNPPPGIKKKLTERLTVYENKKADEERARRQEEERKAKEAAEAAERARVEAERKAREAAEAERRRQEDEARRVREAQEAEARRVAEEERKLRAAAEAEAAAIKNAADLDEAIRREAEAKVARAAREREAAEARERAEAQAKADAARREREAAEARARADAEAKVAAEAAERAAADAAKAEAAAKSKASELHTVRGDYGSSSSLKSDWRGFITDLPKLLADPAIHPFLGEEAAQKALNAYTKIHKGNGKLAGADIRLVTGAVVRG